MTSIDLGGGDDELVVGTVPLDPGHGQPHARVPRRRAGRRHGEHDERQLRARCSSLGDGQNDRFEVNHNRGKLTSHGGAGNDRFLLKTFLVLKREPGRPRRDHEPRQPVRRHRHEPLRLPPERAGASSTAAPASTRSSSSARRSATSFVVTDTYIAGAGRIVTFTAIEAVEVDGAGGADQIYVLVDRRPIRDDHHRRLGRRHDPHRRRPADARLRPAAVHLHAAAVHGHAAARARLRHDAVV